jgi:uncharacterized membrane protein YciS (DUF1049 family)
VRRGEVEDVEDCIVMLVMSMALGWQNEVAIAMAMAIAMAELGMKMIMAIVMYCDAM